MTRTPFVPRRRWRLFLLCACGGLGACSWLEAEFSSLDRLPPAYTRPVDAPVDGLCERP